MKINSRIILTLIFLIFIMIQCSKNTTGPQSVPESSQEDLSEIYIEVEQMGDEIDGLEELALTDSTDRIEHLLQRALRRLDWMLDRASLIIIRHDNEEAESLYELARQAQRNAIDAFNADNYEQAFDFVKESRHYTLEALRLIKEDIEERREDIALRLEQGIRDVQALLDQVSAALENQENERVERIYHKAAGHLGAARETLDQGFLRRAGFHLREARMLAHLALRILNPSD